MSFDRYCLYKCFESKNTCLQLNQYYIVTPSVTAPGKKLSIVFSFQSSSLIQVFWVGGGGRGRGRGKGTVSINCLHLYVHVYVTPGEVSQ